MLVAIMANLKAGSHKTNMIHKFCRYLHHDGFKTKIFIPKTASHSQKIAREIARSGHYKYIVAAGGDGSIATVATGILGTNTPLCVLPMGTANVFAHEMGITGSLKDIAHLIKKACVKTIWPAIAHFPRQDSSTDQQLILQMIGVGPDAYSVYNVNTKLKKWIGRYAYFVSGLTTLRHYPFHQEITLDYNGQTHRQTAVIISKGRYYAGHYQLTPTSQQTHKQFNVIPLQEKKARDWLWQLAQMGLKKTNVKCEHSNEVLVSSSKKLPVQCDGDFCGYTPFSVRIAPQPFYVVVPSEQSVSGSHI